MVTQGNSADKVPDVQGEGGHLIRESFRTWQERSKIHSQDKW